MVDSKHVEYMWWHIDNLRRTLCNQRWKHIDNLDFKKLEIQSTVRVYRNHETDEVYLMLGNHASLNAGIWFEKSELPDPKPLTKEWFQQHLDKIDVPAAIKRAAERITRSYGITGIADPGYIANVIHTEIMDDEDFTNDPQST